MTNMHSAIPEEKLTEAYRLLLEMRDNCVKQADNQYDDPKREAKCEALNIAMTAMGRSIPSRWIPVEERLPEDNGEYLVSYKSVSYKSKKQAVVQYEVGYGFWRMTSYYEGFDQVLFEGVTHWMPLPEPPKEV